MRKSHIKKKKLHAAKINCQPMAALLPDMACCSGRISQTLIRKEWILRYTKRNVGCMRIRKSIWVPWTWDYIGGYDRCELDVTTLDSLYRFTTKALITRISKLILLNKNIGYLLEAASHMRGLNPGSLQISILLEIEAGPSNGSLTTCVFHIIFGASTGCVFTQHETKSRLHSYR